MRHSQFPSKVTEDLLGAGHSSGYKGNGDTQDDVSDFAERIFQDRRQAINKPIYPIVSGILAVMKTKAGQGDDGDEGSGRGYFS